MDLIIRLILVVVLTLLNGFFVASEYALVSMRRSRIDELIKRGSKQSKNAKLAIDNMSSLISATQLGITLASLGLGWLGEPAVARVIEPLFNFFPENIHIFTTHTISFLIAFSIITYIEVLIGELIPKSIAIQKTESTFLHTITPLLLFASIFRPFIHFLNISAKFILKQIGLNPATKSQPTLSEEEIKIILANSASKGIFEKQEVDMVYKVLQFADISVKKIMLPCNKIIAFDKNVTIQDILKVIKVKNHSRYPIYEKNLNKIIGFIHIRDIYSIIDTPKETEKLSKSGIIRKILFVSMKEPADEVLYRMRNERIHIAAVMNKKETVGIATLEDIIENIIGDIRDEFEKPVQRVILTK